MRQPWPDAEDLLTLLAEWTGPQRRIRDGGILVAVSARPHARLVGQPAYPTALEQAAALLHGIVVWRPLEVWNAGLGWAATQVFLLRAGFKLTMPAKERMALTEALVDGEVDSVAEITSRLSPYLEMLD